MIQFDEHIFQMGWFKHQPVGQDWELAEQQRDDALMALQLLGQVEDDPHNDSLVLTVLNQWLTGLNFLGLPIFSRKHTV